MVRIELPYLDRMVPLDLTEENLMAVVEPNEADTHTDSAAVIRQALEEPAGSKGSSLAGFLAGAQTVLVIVNDATRPTPTPAMLDVLVPAFVGSGIGIDGITILVATGAHRGPTEQEYRQILGQHFDSLRCRCQAHDARDRAALVNLGSTRNGTLLSLNRLLFQSDRIVATGSVEPHYFAGYTGGRKAFLPGVAGYPTIEANHKLALSPKARSLALEGNPVHEDMLDALPLLAAPVFALMTVLDKEQKITAATAGDLMVSFFAAVEHARRIFCVSIPALADVVISVARFPMDIDLYQSQKAIDNGAQALKDGGTLVLVSSCRDGIGDETYAGLLASAGTPQEALNLITGRYRLGYHKAAKMAAVSARAHITAVTELEDSRLLSMFIQPAASVQAAVDAGLALARKNGILQPKVLILADGCVTVPELA